MAVRHAEAQTLAAPAASVMARHVGGGPCLIVEDELVRIEVELAIKPGLALPHDIGAVRFRGMGSLFCA